LETAQIAVDPLRQRDYSLPVGVGIEAGGHLVRTLVPPIFRAYAGIKRISGRTAREEGQSPAAFARMAETGSYKSGWVRDLEARHPLAWTTHPHIREILRMADQGRHKDVVDAVRHNRHRLESFLRPVVLDVLSHVGVMPIELREAFTQADEALSLQEQFPVSRFGKSNLRGVKDYDQDLFGKDLLDRLGANLKKEETILWRMIQRLPGSAHLADWGSGAGIFGHEVKQSRPDLKITSVDLFSPEDILALAAEPPASAGDLRREMNFLTGHAAEVSLSPDQGAECLVSVFLIPWVPHPLGLFAHMYNQVRPGGVMAATLHAEIYDADRPWGERTVVPSIVEDLRNLGIGVETANRNRTVVLRRPDERKMAVAADLLSSTFEEIVGPFHALALYHSFYRKRAGTSGGWVTLL